MKKNSFFLELIKSGPFLLLLVLAVVIFLAVILTSHHREAVKMRENVLYVTPKPQKK
jgi:hypothetical protein